MARKGLVNFCSWCALRFASGFLCARALTLYLTFIPCGRVDTEYKGLFYMRVLTRPPLPAHERGGSAAGDRPHRSDLERLDDARKLAARAHRDAHGPQVLGLEERERLDVADVLPSQYRYEALEIKGGQGAFERRTSKR